MGRFDLSSFASGALSVAAIRCRRVLNSHCRWTDEFIVTLANGSSGIGASPVGETVGRFERSGADAGKRDELLETLTRRCRVLPRPSVRNFDAELEDFRPKLGANITLALSLAYLDAICRTLEQPPHGVLAAEFGVAPASPPRLPRLLLNLLNGGRHAYTNPVLSDFPEVLLVPDDVWKASWPRSPCSGSDRRPAPSLLTTPGWQALGSHHAAGRQPPVVGSHHRNP